MKILYNQYDFLITRKLGLEQIVEKGYKTIEGQIDKFDDQSKISILDALLAYHQYQIVATGDSTSPVVKRRQQSILNARFSLPARPSTNPLIDEIPPPTLRSPPIKFGTGLRFGDDTRYYGLFSWSPYSSEIVGSNSNESDELVVLDVTAGISDEGRSVFIDNIDFLKIVHLNTLSIPIDEQNPWSWQLRFGLDRLPDNSNELLNASANFGVGKAWTLCDFFILYAMLDIAGHSEGTNFRATPQLGLLAKQGNFKTFGYYGRETMDYSGQNRGKWELTTQYNASSQYALRLNIKKQKTAIYSLGISWFF